MLNDQRINVEGVQYEAICHCSSYGSHCRLCAIEMEFYSATGVGSF
ncbi:MAG TPA: hypothetical protein QF836_03825 [Nitrospinota bacterium]|nr:hypothetical protein [Nitrospinota bacterium]